MNVLRSLKYTLACSVLMALATNAFSQIVKLTNWQFRQVGTQKWNPAVVPGSVHTDLLHNKMIPDPFYACNEAGLKWIDSVDWEYQAIFEIDKKKFDKKYASIHFEGIDTYADVFLNGKKILSTDNMFRLWKTDISKRVRQGMNRLKIIFHSPIVITNKYAEKQWPLVLPDDARVYARKAQYQFGWDWGPSFVSAGLWKSPVLVLGDIAYAPIITKANNIGDVKLIQQQDSTGTSFYFTKNDQPLYIKGANWIPAHAFPSATTAKDYRELLIMAKEAGMNMLRVWGGGIYEQDYFYNLCNSLGIMVWQDFMFACRMYPGDKDFFANVKAEVKAQVQRLSQHDCIVVWCGNNEVDEGWHHWGWQNQFNLHGKDSAKVWNDYERLFKDSLRIWTNEFDRKKRPYISTSPQFGWGNPKSYTHGDSHYWGLWWGLEPWEKFKTHTGRFVSEWGMQAMPDYSTVKKYVPENERYLYSPAVNAHQKAGNGFMKLNHYINQYFFDTTQLSKLSLEEYTYLSQCLQYYVLKNSLATQMSKQPASMGTLIWQLNDCWPVTSWSLIDFYKQPKAGYFAAKNAFTSMDTSTDKIYPKNLSLSKPSFKITMEANGFNIVSDKDAYYVLVDFGEYNKYICNNYFTLQAGKILFVPFRKNNVSMKSRPYKIISLYDILSK